MLWLEGNYDLPLRVKIYLKPSFASKDILGVYVFKYLAFWSRFGYGRAIPSKINQEVDGIYAALGVVSTQPF